MPHSVPPPPTDWIPPRRIPPGPRTPIADPASTERLERARRYRRLGAGLLGGAITLHLLSIPVTYFVVMQILAQAAGRPVSLGELLTIPSAAPLVVVLIVGITAQIAFALVAVAGLGAVRRRSRAAGAGLLTAGVFAAAFSIVVFGGIVALIGGALTATAGVVLIGQPAPRASP